jgi:hypothetical protein
MEKKKVLVLTSSFPFSEKYISGRGNFVFELCNHFKKDFEIFKADPKKVFLYSSSMKVYVLYCIVLI